MVTLNSTGLMAGLMYDMVQGQHTQAHLIHINCNPVMCLKSLHLTVLKSAHLALILNCGELDGRVWMELSASKLADDVCGSCHSKHSWQGTQNWDGPYTEVWDDLPG